MRLEGLKKRGSTGYPPPTPIAPRGNILSPILKNNQFSPDEKIIS